MRMNPPETRLVGEELPPFDKGRTEEGFSGDPRPPRPGLTHLGYLVTPLQGLKETVFSLFWILALLSLVLGLAAPADAQLFGKKRAERKKQEQAEKPYEATPKIEKNLERGYELMEAGELEKAQRRFERALDLSVLDEPRAFLALAELNLKQERWEAAAKMAGRTLDVTTAPEYLARANYLRGLGLLRWYEELDRQDLDPPPSLVILERAADSLRRVIDAGSADALDAHLRLAAVYELGGRPEEARAALTHYLEQRSDAELPPEVRDLERRLGAGVEPGGSDG